MKGYQCLFDTYRAAIKFVDLKTVYRHEMNFGFIDVMVNAIYRCFLSLKIQTLRSWRDFKREK